VHGRADAADGPPEPPERHDLLLFGLLQDVAHPGEGHQVVVLVNVSAVVS
jgi:hypothetical protein